MWNHIDTPMIYSEKTLKVKSINIMVLGFLFIFSNEYRKKNPASEWISLYLFPYTKDPTTPASSWMPLFQSASGLSQLCIFFLKLFIHSAILPHLCSSPYVLKNLSSPLYSTPLTKELCPSYPSFFLPSYPTNNNHFETSMQHENC